MTGGLERRTRPSLADRVRFRLNGVSRPFDGRTTAIRDDLADVALAEDYFAPHYAAAVPLACTAPFAAVRGKPGKDASAVTELLHGESFHVLDVRGDWAWGYCAHDHYVGYVSRASLDVPFAPTHRATALAPVFAKADIKAPILRMVPPGGKLAGTMEARFLGLADGFVHARHVTPLGPTENDWTSVAQRYLGAPYVWGGRGGRGVDCSGLVQVALEACGIAAPRDTDQQAGTIGKALPEDAVLQRGDLVFFPGHVGIMADGERLLHANAHWMAVTVEPLADVVARLAPDNAVPITARRRIAP